MFCGNCGTELEDDAKFCPQCGNKIAQSSGSLIPNVNSSTSAVDSQKVKVKTSAGSSWLKNLDRKKCLYGVIIFAVLIILFGSITVGILYRSGTKDVDAPKYKVSGRGSAEEEDDKSADSAKKEDDTVNVTKKLEKQYIERLEAYQEYYEKECDDYEYELWARVTVNKEGLPLLWLCYSVDEDIDSVQTTQLLSYESGEVKVLAELGNTCVCPFVSDEAVAALGWNENFIYIYDADNALFRKIEVPEDDWEEYINENVEEFSYYNYCIWTNEEEQELSYIGKINGGTNYDEASEEAAESESEAVSEEEAEVTQPPIPYVDRKVVENENNNEKFYYADGSEDSWELAKEELDILEGYESGKLRIADGGVEWLTEIEADTMFRVLKNQPAYSSEQLFMVLVANSLYFEHSDGTVYSIGEPINLKEYNLAKASDGKKCELISDYVYKGEFDARYMEDALYEQLDSEPYVTFRGRCSVNGWDWSWDVDDEKYADNAATFTMDDGTVCQFRIELNEAGDKIRKITYIDPMASMSEEEKQEYMVEHEVIPAYEKYVRENPMSTSQEPYSLIFMNDDTIPELVIQGDCEATGNMICTYIDNEVVSMCTSRLMFSFLEKQNLLNNCGGNMGYYYDKIFSIKGRAFECVHSGEWMESYDDEGQLITDENGNILYKYSWNGQQVSSDEYNNSLAQVYDDKKAISSYDLIYYSSIQDAYESAGKYVFRQYGGYITKLEMMNNILTVETQEGKSISYPIDENCEWLDMGSDGTIYGNHTFETLKDEISKERERYLEAPESYDSPTVLIVEIKNATITKIRTSTP